MEHWTEIYRTSVIYVKGNYQWAEHFYPADEEEYEEEEYEEEEQLSAAQLMGHTGRLMFNHMRNIESGIFSWKVDTFLIGDLSIYVPEISRLWNRPPQYHNLNDARLVGENVCLPLLPAF